MTAGSRFASVNCRTGHPVRDTPFRHPLTGRVQAILRDLAETGPDPGSAIAAAPAVRGLDLLFSRGIPAPEAWRR